MHQVTLQAVVDELARLLLGRFFGKIFQLATSSYAIDFGLKSRYLFLSLEPRAPRLYLVNRRHRELEKASLPLSTFAQAMRVNLGGGSLTSVTKDPEERVVRFAFSVTDELGDSHDRILLAQLTGRSANLFLLNSAGHVTHALRPPRGEGQQIGDLYRTPPVQKKVGDDELPMEAGDDSDISAALDQHYSRIDAQEAFASSARAHVARVSKEITKRRKLRSNLEKDLRALGNPEEHERLGNLLLANPNAERTGNQVKVIDYYAEGTPVIEVEVDDNVSLQQAAQEHFLKYGKSKRGLEEIEKRLVQLADELKELEKKRASLEVAIATGEESALIPFAAPETRTTTGPSKAKARRLPGMRHYRSSDGYEVIVGRAARDNDNLTFRVARPNDLWLHAADYPGSHVIVRNPSRKEIPHRTIIEAAQLAARFSQAGNDSKVTIHYTQRKFLTKPKGAAPGLVRMSSFRSITVEPGENIEREPVA